MNKGTEWPAKLAQPARRALANAGYDRLEQLTQATKSELHALHGMGPKALELLRQELSASGLSFKVE